MDVAVTGSQKALSIPTGLGMVCVSDKALAAMESATLKRVYYDFRGASGLGGRPPLCSILCQCLALRQQASALFGAGLLPRAQHGAAPVAPAFLPRARNDGLCRDHAC